MTEQRFNETYQFLEHNYGSKSRINSQINKILKQTSLLDNQPVEDLISVHFSKNAIGPNVERLFFQLIRLKYLSVMQPQSCYNEDNQYILVYQDYLKYQLNNQKFYELIQQNKGYRILLQLALAFAEFDKRGYPWPLKTIDNIYYIDGLIFLSLADYDFNTYSLQNTCYQTFCQFVRQYFCCYFQEIEGLLQKNSFQVIINYLLEKEGKMHIINHLNPPYENVLIYLLQIQKLQPIYMVGNSVVKSFDTPNIFKQLFGKLKEQIVYKSTKFQSEEVKQQILININREIELMEKFNDQSYMAVCFSYFRIGDYSFLLQKKYVGTLADALKTWKPSTIQQQQKDVYTFSQRFANALKEMHKFNIIHRDLKPENLFFDSLELTTSWVYIADFDRSKQLKENQTQNSVFTTLNANCTPKYDPPEEEQTLWYDVFQYGLIVLTVANRGTYIGHEQGGPRMMLPQQYEQYYGPQAVINHLEKYQYKEEFLDILIKCLYITPQQRPNANQIYDVMNRMSYKAKIIMIPNSGSSSSSQSPVKIIANSRNSNSITPMTPKIFDSQPETIQLQPIIPNFQYQTTYPQFVPNYTPQIQTPTPIFNYPQQQQQQPQQQQPQQYQYQKRQSMEFETPYNNNQPIVRPNTNPTPVNQPPQQQDSNVYQKIKILSVSRNGQDFYPQQTNYPYPNTPS